MNSLLSMKMLPILNGNDVVAPPPNDGSEVDGLSQASRGGGGEREREYSYSVGSERERDV
jgi:hypothetical protein